MKIFNALLALLLSAAMVSCGDDAKKPGTGESIKIGFIVKQPDQDWFQREWKFAEEAGKANGFEVIRVPAPDGQKVLDKISELATKGAKGFVICTPQTTLGPAIMQKARDEGLKVIAVDDRFVDKDGKPMEDVVYLGIAAKEIGQSVGTSLADEMKRRKWPLEETGLCAVTFDQLDTARQRVDGAIDSVKAAGLPEARIFRAPQEGDANQVRALNATNTVLTRHPEIKHWLICGMNDSAVLGAVRAMETAGFKPQDVIGIGINGDSDAIAELQKPLTGFYGSSLLDARTHGYKSAEMLYKWIKDGTQPAPTTLTLGVLITRENLQQVLKDQGMSATSPK